MPIRVACSSCGKQGAVAERLAGQKVKCACGAFIAVPSASAAPANGPTASAAGAKSAATGPAPKAATPQPPAAKPPTAGASAAKAPAPADSEVFALADEPAADPPAPEPAAAAPKPAAPKPAAAAPPAVAPKPAAAAPAAAAAPKPAAAPTAAASTPKKPAAATKAPKPAAPVLPKDVFAREDKTAAETRIEEASAEPKVEDEAEEADPVEAERERQSPKRKRVRESEGGFLQSKAGVVSIAVAGGVVVVGLVAFLLTATGAGTRTVAPPPSTEPPADVVPATAAQVAKTEPEQPAPTPPPGSTRDGILKKAAAAVVRVEAGRGNQAVQCSGFFVSPDGIVATNLRVVEAGTSASVILGDGSSYPVEGMVAVDRLAALVLLKIPGSRYPTLPLAASDLPSVGTKVHALGTAPGHHEGLVTGHREVSESLKVIQVSSSLPPGPGGGPLLSAEGKVLGIFAGGEAVPAARLAKLLGQREAPRPLPGPDNVAKLRWQFNVGDTFYVETIVNAMSKLKLKGKEPWRDDTVHNILLRFKVLKQDDDQVVLEERIEHNKLKVNRPSRMPALLNKTAGAVFTVTLDRQHQLVQIEGLSQLIDKLLDESDEKLQLQFKQSQFDQQVRERIRILFNPGPATVWKGDKWTGRAVLFLPNLGSLQIFHNFHYEGRNQEGERISYTERWHYVPPVISEDDLFVVQSGDLQVEDTKGLVLFDPHAGRLRQVEISGRGRGSLKGRFFNQDGTMDLTTDTTVVTRIFDKPPEAEKAP